MMHRKLIRLVLPFMALLIALSCLTVLTAAARDIDVGFDSRTIIPKQSEEQPVIRIETANPEDLATDPANPQGNGQPGTGDKPSPGDPPGGKGTPDAGDPPGGKDTPGKDALDPKPGGGSPGSGAPGGNPGGQEQPDPNGKPGADGKPGGTGTPDADGNPDGKGNPDGDRLNPDGKPSTGKSPSGSELTPSKLNPDGSTDSGDTNPEKTNAEKTKKPDVPWYEKLWNKAKDFAKGSVAGAIGAGIVIGVVVIGAAIIGVTIGAPVLIAAAVVGIVAGGIYGVMAGDNFSWAQGIGIGGLGAIATIAIGQAGIVTAARAGFQLFKSAGFKGGMQSIGSRIAAYTSGTFRSVWQGLTSLRGATFTETLKNGVKALGQQLMSKGFKVTFSMNLGISLASKLAFEGKLPTTGEMLQMGAESFVGALVIDKVADLLSSQAVSAFGKRMANYFVGAAESLAVDAVIKRKESNYGEVAQMSFIKAFILQPLFKARLNHVRLKQDIGTTLGEVRQQAPDFDASNVSRKQMTNRSLDQMWQNEINPNTVNQNSIDHWNRRGNQVTQNQFDRLVQNDQQLNKIEDTQKLVEKSTEKVVEKGVENNYGLKPGK